MTVSVFLPIFEPNGDRVRCPRPESTSSGAQKEFPLVITTEVILFSTHIPLLIAHAPRQSPRDGDTW